MASSIFALWSGTTVSALTVTTLTTGTAASVLTTNVAETDYTGASAGTITNAPAVGNPTKWLAVNDNGTLRKFPTWP
jgi:hypothetical protein